MLRTFQMSCLTAETAEWSFSGSEVMWTCLWSDVPGGSWPGVLSTERSLLLQREPMRTLCFWVPGVTLIYGNPTNSHVGWQNMKEGTFLWWSCDPCWARLVVAVMNVFVPQQRLGWSRSCLVFLCWWMQNIICSVGGLNLNANGGCTGWNGFDGTERQSWNNVGHVGLYRDSPLYAGSNTDCVCVCVGTTVLKGLLNFMYSYFPQDEFFRDTWTFIVAPSDQNVLVHNLIPVTLMLTAHDMSS